MAASCRGTVVVSLLVVWTAFLSGTSTYGLRRSDDTPTLRELLDSKIKENQKRGGNVHGHIVVVNEAHGLLDKRGDAGDIPVAEEIEVSNEASNVNLFEADIELSQEDYQQIVQSNNGKRNIIKSKYNMWPNKQIPYYVSPELAHARKTISLAINEFEKHTCIRFKEVPGSYTGDHIRLINGRGCSSKIGRMGGGQDVHLGPGCEYVSVIIHEMMHALGIWHEQSRPDRNSYVEVLWDNIAPGKDLNFKKYPHGKLDNLNLPYDTSSIMHYDRFLFSKDPNKKPTIVARGRPWKSLGGQLRGTLTTNDAKEIKSLFNC